MRADTAVIWFKRFGSIAVVLALCVVVMGAYVRLSDAGLGCPDWPGCYGQLTVPQSQAAITHAQSVYPHKPLEAHKAQKEMLHRYLAGSLGLLILGLFLLGWRAKKLIRVASILPTLLLVLVIFQAMLGMWTVTLLLKPVVVTAHLLGGMTTLGLLVWITHRHWGVVSQRFIASSSLRFLIRGALLVVFLQILLGGWTSSNYAALACTDFPTCHGAWLPDMDFSSAYHWIRELGQAADGSPLRLSALTAIQWTHRLGALVTLIYLGWLGWCLLQHPQVKAVGIAMLMLLLIQIGLGIANLVLHLPLVLAVAHNLGAALLLSTIVVLNSKITKLRQ
ncbi:MAG: COX15/CtaA family protein [Methylophilaceae bacterium]